MNLDGFLRMKAYQIFSSAGESARVGFNGSDRCVPVCRKFQYMAGFSSESGAAIEEMCPLHKRGKQTD